LDSFSAEQYCLQGNRACRSSFGSLSLYLDLCAIDVADKDALLVNSKDQRPIFQHELIETHGTLNHSAPILEFASNDVAIFIAASADGREINGVNWSAKAFVIAHVHEVLDRVRQPNAPSICV